MEIFAQDPLARIVGLAETKTRSSGTKLAKLFGVPVTRDYRELLKLKDVDLIIDVTGNVEVGQALQRVRRSEGRAPNSCGNSLKREFGPRRKLNTH